MGGVVTPSVLPTEMKKLKKTSLHSGGSRPSHKVSGTRSKFSKLNESRQQFHFYYDFLVRTQSKFCLDPPLSSSR